MAATKAESPQSNKPNTTVILGISKEPFRQEFSPHPVVIFDRLLTRVLLGRKVNGVLNFYEMEFVFSIRFLSRCSYGRLWIFGSDRWWRRHSS